jgi:hypothetical protein
MQTKKTAPAILVLLVLLTSLGLSGCANQTTSAAGTLLTQDYRKMDNDELTLYYYRLTEEIDRTERSGSGSALSIGIGGGSWGWGAAAWARVSPQRPPWEEAAALTNCGTAGPRYGRRCRSGE